MEENDLVTSFVVFGNTGVGKSTLCNTLTETDFFRESDDTESETDQTIGANGIFDNHKVYVIQDVSTKKMVL